MKHPGTDLLLFFGAGAALLWYVAYKVVQGTGQAVGLSLNQTVPAGTTVLYNNGDTGTLQQSTDVGGLQAMGVTQFTTPDGLTYQVQPGAVPTNKVQLPLFT